MGRPAEDLTDEEIRQVAIDAGLSAELVDQLMGAGLLIHDDGRVRASLKVIIDFSPVDQRPQ